MNCPRCQSALNPVEYDGQTVQVCSQCKGEWLASGELEKIVQHHDEVFTPEELAARLKVPDSWVYEKTRGRCRNPA